MKGFKGFDENLKCRDFQYEVGKTYETDRAELCESGFHFCEAPLDVLSYYPVIDDKCKMNRFCEIDADDVSDEKSEDSKRVSKKLTVGAEIGIPGLVKAHIEYIKEQTKECDDAAKIGSSGDAAQIGSSGYAAKIGSSGDAAQIGSSGDAAQIGSSGDAAQIGSSGRYAQIGSSGRYAQIGSSGDDAKIICKSDHAVVVCAGKRAKIKAPVGTWITLSEYGEYDGEGFPCLCVKSAKIDGETLKADTWYTLKDGEFVKVEE